MRYFCIDYGKKRIGVATSDSGILARPLCAIKNGGDGPNINKLYELFGGPNNNSDQDQQQSKILIVLGLPLYVDGNESPMSFEVRRFGKVLNERLGLDVVYHNEIYTSLDAENYIRNSMGITNPQKIKEFVDSVAATMILQSYIDSMRHNV